MTRLLIGIFAHPDDEAFGPAGTLLKLQEDGYDVHLILLTDGEAGTDPDGTGDLGTRRLAEWQAAGVILGASSLNALHYPDGGLDAVSPAELDTAIAAEFGAILSDYDEPLEVSLMSFEPHGLTGHRDHIAASKAASRLYEGLEATPGVTRVGFWQYCLNDAQAPLDGTAYYEPRAREAGYITHQIDVRPYLARKYAMIDCHATQVTDAEALKKLGDDLLATECFHITGYPTGQES